MVASCALSVVGTAMGLVPFILIYLVVIELMEPVVREAYIWRLVIWSVVAILLRFVTMVLSGSPQTATEKSGGKYVRSICL